MALIDEEDDYHDRRASRPTTSASPPPRWRPRVAGVLLGRREEQPGVVVYHHDERRAVANAGGILRACASAPATPRPHPDADRRLPFVTRQSDEPSAVDAGRILRGGASAPTTPHPHPHPDAVRRLRFVTRHQDERIAVDASGILLGGASAPTDGRGPLRRPPPRPQTDAVPSDDRRLRLITPHPRRAVATAPDVVIVIDDDDDDRLTSSVEQHDEPRAIPASPPPNWQQSVGGIGRLSLPTFDGSRPSFLTPPPPAKADSFGVHESRRALFFTPPAAGAHTGPVFRDPFEICDDQDEDENDAVSTLPPPKRRSLFLDPVKITDGEGDTVDSTATKLPSCAGGRSSGCGGSRRGRGRGAVPAGGRSGARVQVGTAGRGSRARALAELLGDPDHELRPDSGPAAGQELKEWQFERNIDLNEAYEYLDGLLTRIHKLPQGRRITALARKGWIQFYTRLEVCMVVRRQMREAKADPTPVPKRLMAEVR